MFLASALFSYLTLSMFYKKELIGESLETTNTEKSKLDQENSLSYNILLLGYGGAGHDGGSLSDVIMVANINTQEKTLALISVPRDLWVAIPIRSDISESYKINAAYAIGGDDTKYPLKEPEYKGEMGGGEMAKMIVGKVVGMPIHYFLAVDFDNFKRIIDVLNGVDVSVEVTFDDYFYPIKGAENETCGKTASEIAKLHELYSDTELHHQFECRYEHIHFDKGITHMDGETALKFVRSRASAQHGGDFARSQRQKAVLSGVKDKLISLSAMKKGSELFDLFKGMVKTDLNSDLVNSMAERIGNPKSYGIKFVSLTEENVLVASKSLNGQFILVPKEGEGVWNKVQKYIYDSLNSN